MAANNNENVIRKVEAAANALGVEVTYEPTLSMEVPDDADPMDFMATLAELLSGNEGV